MTRKETCGAALAFFVAACASGVSGPLLDGAIGEPDGGVPNLDASSPDGGGSDGGSGDGGGGGDGGSPSSNDGLPIDALAITFATSCPAGYEPLEEATGRFLLGANSNVLGTSSAAPFGHLEDPTHVHIVSGNVQTRKQGIVGATTSSGNFARPEDPAVNVSTTAATLGLSYVELRVCRKMVGAAAGAPALPQGTVVPFVSDACPDGFVPYAAANGRFVAGLPAGGTNATSHGGAPMTSGESFSHQHTYNGQIELLDEFFALATNGDADYTDDGTHDFTLPASSVSTTLPFVRLLYCEKL